MKKEQKKLIRNFTAMVSAILICVGMMFWTGIPVFAADDTAIEIELNSKSNTNNVSFQVENMFPGDVVSNKYDVEVSFQDKVTVYFGTEIREGYEKLAEVLQCRVLLADTGELLYEGLMKDMPDNVEYTLTAGETSTDMKATVNLCYEITAYLDTSVGNEYQETSLIADFVWWIEAVEDSTPTEPGEEPNVPPQAGDDPDDPSQSGGILDVLPDEVVEKLPESIVGALTGDASDIALWFTLALCVGAVITVSVRSKKWSKTGRKLVGSIVLTAVLLTGFGMVAYAAIHQLLAVESNSFQTGKVSINLNDSKPVIEANEFLFEPGMTVVKDFFLENNSTIEVYYKIYLDNAEGGLADILEVTLTEGDKVLYQGKAADMAEKNAESPDDTLMVGEKRWFSISFYYPYNEANKGQNAEMCFDVCAEAVQTVNNPNRKFE